MKKIYGKLMKKVMELNRQEGITVYLCVNGLTGCISLTVEEKRSVIYQNRCFMQNRKGTKKLLEDVRKMLSVKAGEKETCHALEYKELQQSIVTNKRAKWMELSLRKYRFASCV